MLLDGFSSRHRNRRNLASAFVGEITAAMEAVEEHAEVKRLQLAASTNEQGFDFSDFQLPKLIVYEKNVSRLSLFNAPLPRELSYFYTRLMALPAHLRALRLSSSSGAEDVKWQTQDAVAEIAKTMRLGENLLRSIKIFVSRKQPDSISRA
jgi:hypothetical protein